MTESKVYLRSGGTGELIEGSLFDEVTPAHLRLWDREWVPAMRKFTAGKPPGQRPEDSHWDWRRKARSVRGMLGFHSSALICREQLQGLMMTNDMTSARLHEQFGKPLIYVEFVATAPWNRPKLQNPPRFRGVGQVFILAAIETSRDAGYKGRLGLHSLPEAEPFYEQRCGFTRLGADSSHQDLTYFEMTETQAEAFRQNP